MMKQNRRNHAHSGFPTYKKHFLKILTDIFSNIHLIGILIICRLNISRLVNYIAILQ